MKRNVDFNEISDGKRYSSNDMARISCNGCKGCSECCRVTDDTIHLDPYDVCQLCTETGLSFEELLNQGIVDFTTVEGLITPYLKKNKEGACIFLSVDGLCKIHKSRPGLCRLFPLGRIYNDDDSFDYFIQVHECPYPSKSKVKIKQWLDIPDLSQYEGYISAYHKYLAGLKAEVLKSDDASLRAINLKYLNEMFLTPYSPDSFYSGFYSRIGSK